MIPLPVGTTDEPFHPNRIFAIPPDARRRHIYVLGKTGVGKTTLLANMISWDIGHGLGVSVFDPHGGLVQAALEMIPTRRTNDVVYFKPDDRDHVLGINPLDVRGLRHRPLAVSHVLSIMKAQWADSWGPRMEDILRSTLFALVEQPQPYSLLAVPRVLNDASFRRRILKHVTNPVVRAFFRVYEDVWDRRFRAEAIAPVLNKVNALTTHPLLRAVIGQPTSSVDFRWLIDTQKIFLCDLSKGALGEDVSELLGSLLMSKLTLAALSREDVPEEARPEHAIYADEAQSFVHGAKLPMILSETRKYNLTFTGASQTIAQLPPEAAQAVFGNCATLISFRVGGEDAETLEREFATLIPASQLQELAEFKAYVRTMSVRTKDTPSIPSGPHEVRTFPPFSPGQGVAGKAHVVRESLRRWARPRADVEARLNKFLSP